MIIIILGGLGTLAGPLIGAVTSSVGRNIAGIVACGCAQLC